MCFAHDLVRATSLMCTAYDWATPISSARHMIVVRPMHITRIVVHSCAVHSICSIVVCSFLAYSNSYCRTHNQPAIFAPAFASLHAYAQPAGLLFVLTRSVVPIVRSSQSSLLHSNSPLSFTASLRSAVHSIWSIVVPSRQLSFGVALLTPYCRSVTHSSLRSSITRCARNSLVLLVDFRNSNRQAVLVGCNLTRRPSSPRSFLPRFLVSLTAVPHVLRSSERSVHLFAPPSSEAIADQLTLVPRVRCSSISSSSYSSFTNFVPQFAQSSYSLRSFSSPFTQSLVPRDFVPGG